MEDLQRKKSRGKITNKLNVEEKAKAKEDRSNQYLTYDVLRIIFKYLNGMDLSSASLVCRSWLEAANNEKRIRGPVSALENYGGSSTDEKESVERLKRKIIKNLTIKPVLGLFFTTPSIPFSKEDCHCKDLPPNCETVTLGTYGVVIENKEVEENVGNIVYTFLPEIPNMTIRTFTLEDNLSRKSDLSKSIEKFNGDMKKVLGEPYKKSDKSRCLLLFCDLQGREETIKIVNSLKRCYPGDFLSVWGGVARDLLVCNSKTAKSDRCGKFPFCVGIVLVGSVNTWSIIVDKRCKSREQVQWRLKSLRSSVCLKKHSMGFMFACCARGENMFGDCNVESSTFKEVFPEVPLVGCFGDGEFGENTIRNESADKRTKWYNESSTVFMILTYG